MQIPANLLFEDDHSLVFHDLQPEAPVHLLVIPKEHITNVADSSDDQKTLLGHLLLVSKKAAELTGIDKSGYRIVTNSGYDGGQSVYHLHMHVMGGRKMTWPPG
jgi:histidine triad (HIT) family protein